MTIIEEYTKAAARSLSDAQDRALADIDFNAPVPPPTFRMRLGRWLHDLASRIDGKDWERW